MHGSLVPLWVLAQGWWLPVLMHNQFLDFQQPCLGAGHDCCRARRAM